MPRVAPPVELPDAIEIHGAREHNLKNLSVRIPRGQLVVVTGVSGSGKSTLAFDLLFAEGQRRFLDSMSAYARQFVEQLARPDVDLVAGIPPTVSIEQRNSRGGGKSTVATVTEIHHFLRLLFARLGTPYCPDCLIPIEAQTRDGVAQRLAAELRERGDLLLLAPVVRNRKGFHAEVAEWAARHGYAEIRADGCIHSVSQPFRLDRYREHNVEVVIGIVERTKRRALTAQARRRIDEALEVGHGALLALDNHGQVTVHSTERNCSRCGRSFEPLDPKHFSYNSPRGWCPRCRGFGELFYLPDVDRGARADAIEESWYGWQEGEREVCPECGGRRLNPVARAVRLDFVRAAEVSGPARRRRTSGHQPTERAPTLDFFADASVDEALAYFRQLRPAGRAALIAQDILPEIRERLRFLHEVGLGYLQLGRGVPTLSGGEAQRIRLAAQLGSNLTGVLYILDEPTIGLHARDNERLLAALALLRARGNSLVVVEHDEATMREADFIIDLGPGAGQHGGEVIATGSLPELLRHEDSVTGQCLRARHTYPSRGQRRPVRPPASGAAPVGGTPARGRVESRSSAPPPDGEPPGWLVLRHAAKNNLRDLTVRFPLGRLILVTGVSGSGKSTLLRECLLPAVKEQLQRRPHSNVQADARSPHPLPGAEGWDENPPNPFAHCAPEQAGRDARPRASRPSRREEEERRRLAGLPTSDAPVHGEGTGREGMRRGVGAEATPPQDRVQAVVTGAESLRAVYEVDQSPIGRTPRSVPATYVGFFDDIRSLFAQVPEARLRGYTASRFSFNSAQGRCPECEGAGSVKLEMNFLPPAFARCESCGGLRFSRETLDVEFRGRTIAQVLELTVDEALEFFAAFPRIRRPLQALHDTGLGYLHLGQTSPTLSGGEAQRVKLVTHLLAGLKEEAAVSRPARPEPRSLFLLEEPTIGLHIADVRLLVDVLQRLVDAGHTVVVIEHNLDLIAEADWVIDLGPDGGSGGGRIVAEGTPEEIALCPESYTGRYLRRLFRNAA